MCRNRFGTRAAHFPRRASATARGACLLQSDHGLPYLAPMCRRPRTSWSPGANHGGSRSAAGGRGDPAASLCRRWTGAAVHAHSRLPLPDARQSVRHDGSGAVPVSRQPRERRAAGRPQARSDRRRSASRGGSPARRACAACMLPKTVSRADVTANETTIAQLPQQVSWPDDGGAFITLPQVYTEDVRDAGLAHARTSACTACSSPAIEYEPNREIGLHYQIHRCIGVHHAAALAAGRAVPREHLRRRPAGDDARRRDAAARRDDRAGLRRGAGRPPRPHAPPPGRAADPRRRRLLHRRHGRSPTSCCPKGRSAITWATTACARFSRAARSSRSITATDAIWPFTVVGRPPQEDTIFGQLIHELTGAGDSDGAPRRAGGPRGRRGRRASAAAGDRQRALHAVRRSQPGPQELLTQANAILGQGQLSLAKYLLIVDHADDPQLDVARRRRVPRAHARAGRLDARSALPDADDDRHARLLGRRRSTAARSW